MPNATYFHKNGSPTQMGNYFHVILKAQTDDSPPVTIVDHQPGDSVEVSGVFWTGDEPPVAITDPLEQAHLGVVGYVRNIAGRMNIEIEDVSRVSAP